MKITIQELRQLQDKNREIPVLRGCTNEQCFCTGTCKQIIGYYKNGEYTPLPKSDGVTPLSTQYNWSGTMSKTITEGKD